MKVKYEELEKIKKTQSVYMAGNRERVLVRITESMGLIQSSDDTIDGKEMLGTNEIGIPIKSVFQVKRGLESYVQRFYRKHESKKSQH